MLLFFISNFRQKFQYENEVTTAVYNALRENDIRIPFPARTLYKGDDLHWDTADYPGSQDAKVIKKKPTNTKRGIKKKTSKKK